MATGTKRSRPTDLLQRYGFAIGAATALTALTVWSRALPTLATRADALASMAVGLALVTVLVLGLLPLRVLGWRLLVISAAMVPLAVACTWLGVVPAANLAKILFAVSLGLWLADQIETVSVIVVIAVLAAVVDIYSVFLGPTRALLSGEPQVVGYFVIAFAWFGYSTREAYSALGTSDVIFFALFVGAAVGLGLRVRLSALLMALSVLLTVVLALWARALPAIPLLSAAFLAANADLIRRRLAGRGGAARRDGGDS